MAMNRLPLDSPGAEAEFERIEVRRSGRRKKTISAEIVGDALVVSIPERMSRADEGRALAYSFLRDAPASCRGNWDEWGPVVGRGIGFIHRLVGDAYGHLETLGITKAAVVARRAAQAAWDGVKWAGRGLTRAGSEVVDAVGAAGRFLRGGWARLWGKR